jgi:ABC-type oligopeptide transport system substrate-binding subunit
VPRHVVEQYGEAWAKPENVVTCGPFTLESWQPGELMTLVRNPSYHGRFTGNLERVDLVVRDLGPPPRAEMLEMYGRIPLCPGNEDHIPPVRHQPPTL